MKIASKVSVPEIPLNGDGSLQRQIYKALRRSILHGRLPAGFRLPASRSLAAKLGVSRNTILCVYDELIAEGLVAGRVGSGTRVDRVTAVEFSDPDGHRLKCAGPNQ